MALDTLFQKNQFYSPFRYPGGKSWLLPLVGRWLSSNSGVVRLCEPFAGGASVGLFAGITGLVKFVRIAEADGGMAGFWKAAFMQGGAERLAQRIETFKFTEKCVRNFLAQDGEGEGPEDAALVPHW